MKNEYLKKEGVNFMVYVLMVNGFEDIEALEPVDIMRRAGLLVKTVGVTSKKVTSSHNVTIETDITIDEISKDDMEMLVLPGGPGHTNLDESKDVHELISYAMEHDIYISAICASPSILGKLGILDGKNYTCFPGFEKFAPNGIFSKEKAVLDGKILTARGAGCAGDFGFKMVEILKDKETAEKLIKEMQYI